LKKTFIAIVLLFCVTTAVLPQASNSMLVSAVVTGQGLVIGYASPLHFSDGMTAGITIIIDPTPGAPLPPNATNPSVGIFDFSGATNAHVSVSYVLPASLTGPGAPIPVTYTGGYVNVNSLAGIHSDWWVPNPIFTTGPHTFALPDPIVHPGGTHVRIGGQVIVPVNQVSGAYSANISVTGSYTAL